MKKIARSLVALCFIALSVSTTKAQLSVSISVGTPPPALPVYVQPACPTDGYLWVPGYWAYNNDGGYYWVPGVWVAPPQQGLLWTPAYWGYDGGVYGFHAGYWGPHVGFYGGINYGYGYGGSGFVGGNWDGGHFRYNTAVVTVNTTVVHNVYVDRTVVVNNNVNHTSFNGPGGVRAQPRPEERTAMNERHFQPTAQQSSHQQSASQDRSQFASNNGGHPTAAAMNHVGGRPFNAQGERATGSSLGHGGFGNKPNGGQPAGAARPADNQPAHNQPQAQPAHNQPQAQPQHNQPQPQHNQPQQRSAPHSNPRPAHERH
jgi:WXXGXW repeat (2 copies)